MSIPDVNDPMTMHATGAGVWGLPSQPDTDDRPAVVPPPGYDYSAGMLVGAPVTDADAVAPGMHPGMLARGDFNLRAYEAPHEATHRRYEPPFTVPINQTAAGFTLVAPPTNGLHYIKVLGCFLTLDAAGTIRFVQGDLAGINVAAMTGNVGLGGAATPPLVLATAEIANPWLFTSPDQALGIVTVTGKAQGWILCCNSPYDA